MDSVQYLRFRRGPEIRGDRADKLAPSLRMCIRVIQGCCFQYVILYGQ